MAEDKPKAIANKFEASTGVNLEDYRRPEIAEFISNILTFPIYAGKYIIIPLFIYLIITSILALLVTGYFSTLVAIILIPVASIINALTTAAIPFIFRLRSDITQAVSAGLGLTKEVSEDVRNVYLKKKNNTLEFPGFGETFRGVMHVVIVPTIIAVLKRKIPLIGGLFSGLVRRLANLATRKTIEDVEAEYAEEVFDESLPDGEKEARLIKRMQTVAKVADSADKIVTQSIKWASRILFIPVVLNFIFFLVITIVCYYLIF